MACSLQRRGDSSDKLQVPQQVFLPYLPQSAPGCAKFFLLGTHKPFNQLPDMEPKGLTSVSHHNPVKISNVLSLKSLSMTQLLFRLL